MAHIVEIWISYFFRISASSIKHFFRISISIYSLSLICRTILIYVCREKSYIEINIIIHLTGLKHKVYTSPDFCLFQNMVQMATYNVNSKIYTSL